MSLSTAQASRLAFRLALRNLRQGLGGFGIFLACIALGVTAIVGIESLSRALSDGLGAQGREIVGGDLSLSRMHRPVEAPERTVLQTHGQLASLASLRAMALGGSGAALVDVKAVDAAYPTIGTLSIDPPQPLGAALAASGETYGAVADPALFARLGLKTGDIITIGEVKLRLSGALTSEPDRLGSGLTFGPRLLISQDTLTATGLIQPGSLIRWTYRLILPEGHNADTDVTATASAITHALPEAGFELRTRMNASPQLAKNIERFTQFLTIVGLTALIVGGTGVANAVTAHLERRRDSFAILKTLGASGTLVFGIAMTEVILLGLAGVGIGLCAGAALPFAVAELAGPYLPVTLAPHLYPVRLWVGAGYGLLTVLAFSLGPVGRAHDISVAALFRDEIAPGRSWPRLRYLLATAFSILGLATAVIAFSSDMKIAAYAVLGTAVAFVALRAVAFAIMALARHLPRPRTVELRLAVANIHRPGALTPSLTLSLGLGVALLVTVSLIDSNIRAQLTKSLPERAPSFFFIDIPNRDLGSFDAFLKSAAPTGKIDHVPMIRGRITKVNGTQSENAKVSEDAAWVLDGDRGITYSATLPEGSTLTEGQWWPQDEKGPPLVSIEAGIARGLGLTLGDTITVNVLGRSITATIANLRRVEWQSLGINFVLVFSPNSFAGAPSTFLATLSLPKGGDVSEEAGLLAASAKTFPAITAIRVKEALEAINELVGKLALAIRGASGITVLASILVLAGALGTGHRARVYDAVILKTLGATRARLIAAYALEYGLLGFAASLFGLLAGTAGAWLVVEKAMRFGFIFAPIPAALTCLIAVSATILIGLIGTWSILGEKPAAYLRGS